MFILTLSDNPELVGTWLNFRGYILSIVFDNSLAHIKAGKENFSFTKNLGKKNENSRELRMTNYRKGTEQGEI